MLGRRFNCAFYGLEIALHYLSDLTLVLARKYLSVYIIRPCLVTMCFVVGPPTVLYRKRNTIQKKKKKSTCTIQPGSHWPWSVMAPTLVRCGYIQEFVHLLHCNLYFFFHWSTHALCLTVLVWWETRDRGPDRDLQRNIPALGRVHWRRMCHPCGPLLWVMIRVFLSAYWSKLFLG